MAMRRKDEDEEGGEEMIEEGNKEYRSYFFWSLGSLIYEYKLSLIRNMNELSYRYLKLL